MVGGKDPTFDRLKNQFLLNRKVESKQNKTLDKIKRKEYLLVCILYRIQLIAILVVYIHDAIFEWLIKNCICHKVMKIIVMIYRL